MLRTPFYVAVALSIAFAGGIFSSTAAIDANDTFGVLAIGPWEATPLAQTAAADPYAKANRARSGSFALGQAEGLAFRASTDSRGATLSGRCAYRVAGQTPANRLWVLRLTDLTGTTLPAEPVFPQSVHSNSILRNADGTFTLTLDRAARSGNWMKLDHDRPIRIELTLFDTPAAGNFGLIDLTMPEIERLECRDA